MEEKQKTLRPEIQLLNALLAAEGPAQRKEVSNAAWLLVESLWDAVDLLLV